ncbi:hypothetical protein BLS_003930 [Venturia inaequalis]|uniref:DUF7730 domain-containing protein n=1 Tax=Venturia inaequalis TaxID=5025 RepID=A0A8H3UND1_VENIN|nr:hypothetical protein BLS_003930 [Venturia inaequalis]
MADWPTKPPLYDISTYIRCRIDAHCSVKMAFPLEKLPYELRLRIYELAFALPSETVHLENFSSTNHEEIWSPESHSIAGECSFYPYGLKRIPESLQIEALACAYKNTIFKATQMNQIIRLYPMLGHVGLANIETIEIDWIKTEDVSFANGFAIQYSDEQAFQAISLLKSMPRLKNLSVQLNGYAFTLAYANAKQRRTQSLEKDNDLFETYQLRQVISHYYDQRGNRIDLSDTPSGSTVDTPRLGSLWKVKSRYEFVSFLHLHIALCDPFFNALASLQGLKSFELKQTPHLPGGLDPQIPALLERTVTGARAVVDPTNVDPSGNPWITQAAALEVKDEGLFLRLKHK